MMRKEEKLNWQVREQHNLALTLDVTALAHSQGVTAVVAEYSKSYLINGFAAQMVKCVNKRNFADTRDLAFRLVVQDKPAFGAARWFGWIDLAPFLTLPMIYDLPLIIPIPFKSRMQVELRNAGNVPATVRFTFVGTGERDVQ